MSKIAVLDQSWLAHVSHRGDKPLSPIMDSVRIHHPSRIEERAAPQDVARRIILNASVSTAIENAVHDHIPKAIRGIRRIDGTKIQRGAISISIIRRSPLCKDAVRKFAEARTPERD